MTYLNLSETSECSRLQDISLVSGTLRVKVVECGSPYIRLVCVHQDHALMYSTSWAHVGQLYRLTTKYHLASIAHILQGTEAASSVTAAHSV